MPDQPSFPIDNYIKKSPDQIILESKGLTARQRLQIVKYEKAHLNRRDVVSSLISMNKETLNDARAEGKVKGEDQRSSGKTKETS